MKGMPVRAAAIMYETLYSVAMTELVVTKRVLRMETTAVERRRVRKVVSLRHLGQFCGYGVSRTTTGRRTGNEKGKTNKRISRIITWLRNQFNRMIPSTKLRLPLQSPKLTPASRFAIWVSVLERV